MSAGNISASARTIEIEDVVAAVRVAASFLQLDAAEQACTTHPHGPVNCTEEVQARRGQIQDLELSVRRATTTVELDAAEDSCTNAPHAAVECSAWIATRRGEIENHARERARGASSLARLVLAEDGCDDAFVSCTTEAVAREDEISQAVQEVESARSLLQLDGAEQACAQRVNGMVSCAAEVLAKRERIVALHLQVSNAATTVHLDAAEQACKDVLAGAVECTGRTDARRVEIEDPLRDRARAARSVLELEIAEEGCSDAFVNCTAAVATREQGLGVALGAVASARSVLQVNAAEQECELHANGLLSCATEVLERREQIIALHVDVRRSLSIVELDAAQQACDDAGVECAAYVATRRAEVETPLLAHTYAASSLVDYALAFVGCEDGFVSCGTARRNDIAAAVQATEQARSLLMLSAAEEACAFHHNGTVSCSPEALARREEIVLLHLRVRDASSVAELDWAQQRCEDAGVECAAATQTRRQEMTDLSMDAVRRAASLAELAAAASRCSDTGVDCHGRTLRTSL